MPICANKGCETTCAWRYCDACYNTHQAKLTNTCKTCKKKTFAKREYCNTCEVQKNLCKECGQTCRVRNSFCSDCREKNTAEKLHPCTRADGTAAVLSSSSSTDGAIGAILDKICEACEQPANARYCNACREEFRSRLRPCADCKKEMTHGRYCDKCISHYNTHRTNKQCNECGVGISIEKKFCGRCISAYKALQSSSIGISIKNCGI